jgi:aryl-alcohol dehydrogenase-like predicted oxidoreductase
MPFADRGRLVLGTAALGLPYGLASPGTAGPRLIDEPTAIALMRSAQDMGFAAFDTAPAYGEAEARIGAAGLTMPVWTKLASGTPAKASLAASMSRLHRSQVELLQWHNWKASQAFDPMFTNDWQNLKKLSYVIGLGASTYGVEDALAAVKSGRFSVVQVEFNLLNPHVIQVVGEVAKEHNVSLAVRSVLLQGVLTDRTLPPHLSALEQPRQRAAELADSWGLSLSALALRAALDHPAIDWVLVGVDHRDQLTELLAATDLHPLTTAQRNDLRRLAIPPGLTDPRLWQSFSAPPPVRTHPHRPDQP